MILDSFIYEKPPEARLYITKPDRTIVGELKHNYGLKREVNIGSVSRIEFQIPYQITKFNKPVDNPNINKLKDRYNIKFVDGNTVQWYVVKNPTDSMTENEDYKSAEAFSLEIELADKRIRKYEVVSKTASQVLQDALSETIWSIGSVDASFDLLNRAFSVDDNSVLDFIYEVAKTFNALATFDTVNRRVNFSIFGNYGVDDGLEVSYGVLLKNAKKVENSDEFFTRMIGIGKDGIGIQGQNTTGQGHVDDFNYFMYPFSRDGNKNALTHSDYMSDSLCHAILDYKIKLDAAKGTYQTYLTQLSGYQTTLTSQQNTLKTLQNDLAVIEDQISVANANAQSTTTLVAQKNSKLSAISSQQSSITTTNGNISTVQTNMTTLQNTLSMNTNFTSPQLIELNPYIIVGTFENSNVSDSKQLYDLLVSEFDKVKQPKIIVEIGVVNFLKCITEKKRWNKLQLGNAIKITNTRVGIDVKAKIMGYTVDYENDDITLTIANVRELLTDEARVLKGLYRSNMTSGTVTYNKFKWNAAVTDVNQVQSVLDGVWQATARNIHASQNESVTIDRKGIITKDLVDPNKYVVIQHGQIALTNTGGNTWSTAITADGVFAQRLIGQIIAGVNLTITNSGGTFTVNSSGVTITGSALTITGGVPDTQIASSSTWNTATTQAGNSVQLGASYNNVVISAANGINVTDSLVKSKTIMDSSGFRVQKNTGTDVSPLWSNQFSVDTNGDAVFGGKVNGATIIGSTIQTRATGRRIQIDASGTGFFGDGGGIAFYNASNQLNGFVATTDSGSSPAIVGAGFGHYYQGVSVITFAGDSTRASIIYNNAIFGKDTSVVTAGGTWSFGAILATGSNLPIGSTFDTTQMIGDWYSKNNLYAKSILPDAATLNIGSVSFNTVPVGIWNFTNTNMTFTTGSAVGSPGSASALPATPRAYMTIQISGISYKIPLYNI